MLEGRYSAIDGVASGLAGLAYGLLLILLAAQLLRPNSPAARLNRVFLLALLLSACWGLFGALFSLGSLSAFDGLFLALLDLLRNGAWFAFVLLLLRQARRSTGQAPLLPVVALLACVLTGGLLLLQEFGPYRMAVLERPLAFSHLGLAVVGLMLVEQLLRNSHGDSRWGAKPVCLALGVMFVFDLFTYSQAALFGGFDRDAMSIRPAVHSLAVPLFYVAARRHKDWLLKLQVSRAAAFQSAALLFAGAYLLLVSGVGYYMRYTGGSWGRAMQMALLVVATMALMILLLSASMRAKLKVYINKNFFSYRYDYREEWLRFTAMLSAQSSPQELGLSVIKGIANLVESPSGALWLRGHLGPDYVQAAAWNMPARTEAEARDGALAEFLRRRHWIIDLDELRASAPLYEGVTAPAWLLEERRYWLLVPLALGDELNGFVLLGHPRTKLEVNWEVRDLLHTASRQAAGYLAQMQATEALLEARKFEAFNRMSAFVVHDLKNIVTQLSLMMKNARRLRDNPEFQEDMLATVENSLEKMRQLMLQLREGEAVPGGSSRGVELTPIVERLAAAARGKGRELLIEVADSASTRGHEERVERVIGHAVQNAFDATPEHGRVWLRLAVEGSNARVEVGDTGCGMSEEFIRTRLFKPFQTTKANGMGIGAFESFQYLHELGGKIKVESEEGRGSKVIIWLPLFHASHGSDLSMLSAK